MEDKKISLKLFVDVNVQKVIFAEAGSDFVDFLFSLLSLPLGIVIRRVPDKNMVGCIGNLLRSIENMNRTFMDRSNSNVASLLSAPDVFSADDSSAADQKQYYDCGYPYSHRYVSNERGTLCPSCRQQMTNEVAYVVGSEGGGAGGYVKGSVTYMVTDDLRVKVKPSGSEYNPHTNVQFDGLQEKVVEFGIQERLSLVNGCFETKSALTNVFLATC